MSARASSEQRRDLRKSLDIVLNKYINGEPHLCRAVNVSRGGMLLHRVFEPDRLHHAVVLEFQLPGSERVLRAEGMALMGSPGGRSCGVRFTYMSSEACQVLDQFLAPSPPAPRHVIDQGGPCPSPLSQQSCLSLPPPRVSRAAAAEPAGIEQLPPHHVTH